MHISSNGLHLIEGFEGWSSCPYWDGYGGVWTRGFGETEGIGPHSACISRNFGESNLRYRIEHFYEWAIRNLVVPLSQNQWDALCSFTWNLGPGIIGPGTSLGHLLRSRQFRAAADHMLEYDHAGGVVLEGLRTRREAERRLFLAPGGGGSSPAPSVLTAKEEKALARFDGLNRHRGRHPVAWRKARHELIVLRQAIWQAAVLGHQPSGKTTRKGWNINHRGARYNIIWSRTK